MIFLFVSTFTLRLCLPLSTEKIILKKLCITFSNLWHMRRELGIFLSQQHLIVFSQPYSIVSRCSHSFKICLLLEKLSTPWADRYFNELCVELRPLLQPLKTAPKTAVLTIQIILERLFVSLSFLFVCLAYQSVRNQTQKCCVILHCTQKLNNNKKKELYRPFYLWLCSSFGYCFGQATFML